MLGLISLISTSPILFIFVAIGIVLAISIHEAAHAYAAYYLGDYTPKFQGRLTLNPTAHLDPVGTVMILLFGIGWGRPVEFNPLNLKNPKRDIALVALAGPASNIAMAIIFSILLQVSGTGSLLGLFAVQLITLNVFLAVFNMIPVHPLDGFKVVRGLLPRHLVPQWQETARYGMILLIILLISNGASAIITVVASPILNVLI